MRGLGDGGAQPDPQDARAAICFTPRRAGLAAPSSSAVAQAEAEAPQAAVGAEVATVVAMGLEAYAGVGALNDSNRRCLERGPNNEETAMRILIAEDDQVLADGLLRALRGAGAAVDHVASGSEADAA